MPCSPCAPSAASRCRTSPASWKPRTRPPCTSTGPFSWSRTCSTPVFRQLSLHVVHSEDQRELVLGYEGDLWLCFNRTFFAPGQSYSHPLRPDSTVEQGCRRLILDAKFKGSGSGFYGVEAEDGPIQRWREEDIDKMHAYRDAISGVQGAFILYPGLETDLFDHPDQSFPGVGALALRPGEKTSSDPEHVSALDELIDRFCAVWDG